jgi:hypothetical protein
VALFLFVAALDQVTEKAVAVNPLQVDGLDAGAGWGRSRGAGKVECWLVQWAVRPQAPAQLLLLLHRTTQPIRLLARGSD